MFGYRLERVAGLSGVRLRGRRFPARSSRTFCRTLLTLAHRSKVSVIYLKNTCLLKGFWLDSGGRIYRTGVTASGGQVHLGSVNDLLSGQIRGNLSMDKVDTYVLKPLEDDEEALLCEVVLKPAESLTSATKPVRWVDCVILQ